MRSPPLSMVLDISRLRQRQERVYISADGTATSLGQSAGGKALRLILCYVWDGILCKPVQVTRGRDLRCMPDFGMYGGAIYKAIFEKKLAPTNQGRPGRECARSERRRCQSPLHLVHASLSLVCLDRGSACALSLGLEAARARRCDNMPTVSRR